MQFRAIIFWTPLIVGLQAATLLPARAAAWGSIRGNNHDSGDGQLHVPAQAQRQGNYSAPVRRETQAPRQEWHGGAQPTVRTAPRGAVRSRVESTPLPRTGRDVGHEQRASVWTHDAHERQRWDMEGERHNAYYWSRYHSGMRFDRLPLGYSTFSFAGVPYYYYQGVYFENAPAGYVVVPPPIGALAAALPPGAETIIVGPVTYYYAAGAFYVQEPRGFVVVVPPPGVIVPYLPAGAANVIINGIQYYQADGAYFQPAMQDGATVYMTVQP